MSDEMPIYDMVLFLVNDDTDLAQYRLFRVIEPPKFRNGMCHFVVLNPIDVPVRLGAGKRMLNFMLGKPNVVGTLDLDKKFQISVAEDLVLRIKDSSQPNLFLVLPEDFKKLPKEIKNHPYLGGSFDLGLMARHNDISLAESMRQMGKTQSEINDTLSQSQSKVNQFVRNTIDTLSRDTVQQQNELAKKNKQNNEQQDMAGMY